MGRPVQVKFHGPGPRRIISLLPGLILVGLAAPAAEARGRPPAAAAAAAAATGQSSHQGFVRGMALGIHSRMGKRELKRKMSELAHLGASHVSLVVAWSMTDVRSTTIKPRGNHATPDPLLERMIRQARSRGLKVLLFPIVGIKHRRGNEWRGALRPPDWNAWWSQYDRFILHYARIAARHKLELFSVGSELVVTEKMRSRWKSLIGRVRRVYSGKVLYSANWDHYRPVAFWDLVDVVGLTAYYRIADGPEAGESEMLANWRSIRRALVKWSRQIRRPFVFTEVGYPSRNGGAVEPWDYTRWTGPDPEEQRRAYSAFVRAWRGVPQLAGVVFWDWSGKGGTTDFRYTPRGKPAAQVVHRWFSRLRTRSTSGER